MEGSEGSLSFERDQETLQDVQLSWLTPLYFYSPRFESTLQQKICLKLIHFQSFCSRVSRNLTAPEHCSDVAIENS